MTNIGRMYLQLNDIEKAQDWITRALELRLEKLGEENLYTAETLSASAEIDITQKKLDEAYIKLMRIIGLRQRKLPKDDWRTAESIALLILTKSNITAQDEMVFNCKLAQISKKLGAKHYRVQRLIRSQKEARLSNQFDLLQCEFNLLVQGDR